MPTLYISDLDFTLTQHDATLSDFTRKALQLLYTNGIYFTIASARSVASIQQILKNIPLYLPVIEFNGAFLSDLETGRHFTVNSIPNEVMTDIWNMGQDCGLIPFLSSFDGNRDNLYIPPTTTPGMEWYKTDRITHNDPRIRYYTQTDFNEIRMEDIICMTYIQNASILEQFRSEILQKFPSSLKIYLYENQYSPGEYWMTIYSRKVGKDHAIQELRRHYRLEDYELVVFGDQINDECMFRIADRSYAVKNAVPELQEHATGIIGPHDEDSVMKFILEENHLDFPTSFDRSLNKEKEIG